MAEPTCGDLSEPDLAPAAFSHDNNAPPSRYANNAARHQSFTLRAIVFGLLIGILVNLSNTYYGLRVGAGSQMSMVSALLGYAGFKAVPRHVASRLTPEENVLLVSVATAVGCMPLTAGLIQVIPAIEYLIGPEDGGPLHQTVGNLFIWSMGLCYIGVAFTALLRKQFIERERLPWPGPTATAYLITTLHRQPPRGATAEAQVPRPDDRILYHEVGPQEDEVIELKSSLRNLTLGTAVSVIISVGMGIVPILHELPVFGLHAAKEWLWTVDLSPGFFGQGVIIGPFISFHMLTGAIVGWGILSPYAKHRGWAPGNVDNWETGSRGWIIWVSLAALLADASAKLAWLLIRKLWRDPPHDIISLLRQMSTTSSGNPAPYQRIPSSEVERTSQDDIIDDDNALPILEPQTPDESLFHRHILPHNGRLAATIPPLKFLVSVVICITAAHSIFGNIVPWYYTPLGILLALPMAAVGIRSIAEEDGITGPEWRQAKQGRPTPPPAGA